MSHSAMDGIFREKFLKRQVQFGTFIKTPAPHVVEIIARAGFDFVVLDEEHAPFDRSAIDLALLAARAAHIPALVRTANGEPSRLLASLDDGADGVIVPHIRSREAASELAAACRYSIARGFSASTRAGGYGAHSMWDHVRRADAGIATIAMIEDPEGIANIEQIVKVEGLDGLMVGRADLAVALRDRDPGLERTNAMTHKIIEAAAAAGKPVCLFVSSAQDAQQFREKGVTTFIVSSEQTFMKAGAITALTEMEKLR